MEEKSPNRKVLIIDDDKGILFTLKMRLEFYGYQVITANNSAEGIFLAGVEKPDIVLLDIKMPGSDGTYAFESINLVSPSSTIIFITAYDEEVLKIRDKRIPCHIMRKPLSIQVLNEIIKKAIRKQSGDV
jgi:DNA-binding response OmpR family regulator